MVYAIELFFNKELEDEIMTLAKKIADKGLSTKYLEWETRPHVTLACFNYIDENDCKKRLREFADSHNSVKVNFDSVGMFTDTRVIFLPPTMTQSMYLLHEELHRSMSGFDTRGYEWYLPGGWVPHCAIALMSGDEQELFFKASELVLREFKKSEGFFSSVGLVKISFPVEELECEELASTYL